LAEALDEFAECNDVTYDDVHEALQYTHACVEPMSDPTPARKPRRTVGAIGNGSGVHELLVRSPPAYNQGQPDQANRRKLLAP
jgi:hypothetical protein